MDGSMPHLNISWTLFRDFLCTFNRSLIKTINLNLSCDREDFKHRGITHAPEIIAMATVIFLVGIVCNITLLALSLSDSRFRKVSWKYITNLAAADVLVMIAMACYMFTVIDNSKFSSSTISEYLFPSVDILLSSASLLSVAAIAMHRVQSVRCLTKRTSSIFHTQPNRVILFVWCYSFFIFFLALCRAAIQWDGYHQLVFWTATSVACSAVLVTFVCYMMITCYYVKYSKLCRQLSTAFQKDSSAVIQVIELKIRLTQVRKAFMAVMTPMPFVCGWLYFLITQAYESISDVHVADMSWNIAMIVVPWIMSALNPFVYILISKSVRRQLKKFLSYVLFSHKVLEDKIEETIQLSFE